MNYLNLPGIGLPDHGVPSVEQNGVDLSGVDLDGASVSSQINLGGIDLDGIELPDLAPTSMELLKGGVADLRHNVAVSGVVEEGERLAGSRPLNPQLDAYHYPGRKALVEEDYNPELKAALEKDAATRLAADTKTVKEQNAIRNSIGNSPETNNFLHSGEGELWKNFTNAPLTIIKEIGLRSAPSSAAALPGAMLGGAVGGPAGFASGMAAGSYALEYNNTIASELSKAGVNLEDPNAILAATKDAALMGQIRQKAAKRAAIIGGVDGLTGGLATKTLAPQVVKSVAGREAINLGAQTAVQTVGGATGEALAQLETEGKINPNEVAAEAVGELVMAPVDVAAATYSVGRAQAQKGKLADDGYIDESGDIDVDAAEQEAIRRANGMTEAEALALGYKPDRMIVMPDGTTAYESELESSGSLDANREVVAKHPSYPRETVVVDGVDLTGIELSDIDTQAVENNSKVSDTDKQAEIDAAYAMYEQREDIDPLQYELDRAEAPSMKYLAGKVRGKAEKLEAKRIAQNLERVINEERAEQELIAEKPAPANPAMANALQAALGKAGALPEQASAIAETGAQPVEAGKFKDEPAHKIDVDAQQAATSPANETPMPTEAQIEAGNYKKGHTTIQNLKVAIENPRGSERSGTDPSGKKWSVKMQHHYGYIKKTEGADGEHIDVFVGPNPEGEKVFIVDQVNADGSFDEHKVMMGFTEKMKARHGYKSNYTKDWKVGPITEMSVSEFKSWLKEGDTTKPLSAELATKANPTIKSKPAQPVDTSALQDLASKKNQASQEEKSTPKPADKKKAESKADKTEEGDADIPSFIRSASPPTKHGLPESAVQDIVDAFMEKYPGANDVKTRIHRSATTLPSFKKGRDDGAAIKGEYRSKQGELHLVAGELRTRSEVEQTLQEEIFVHKGLGFFNPKDRAQLYLDIQQAAKDSPAVRELWGQVKRDYAAIADSHNLNEESRNRLFAEELLGKVAQEKISPWRKGFNKVFLAVKRLLVKAKLISESIGMAELRSRVYLMGDAFARGRRAPSRSFSEDITTSSFNRAEIDPYSEAYDSLGDKDKTVFNRVKQALKRELLPGGLLPKAVFSQKLLRDFDINAVEFDIANRLASFNEAIKRAYGKDADSLTEEQNEQLNNALGGREPDTTIPAEVREELYKMRRLIKAFSVKYLNQLMAEIDRLQAEGKSADAEAKTGLLQTIANNLDSYMHRSYRAFDDPSWPKKVPRDVYDRAARYLEQQYADGGEVTAVIQDKVKKKIELMLEEGTAFDSMHAFISETKLGSKDLGVLKKRKDIAPEILDLLGVYKDPRINFTKTVTKMSRLVYNQSFLEKIREVGMGEFLFEPDDAPLNATRKIAGEGSEVYAPLNGLYTFPEIDQAFKDALGNENLEGWYKAIVRFNGAVKFGKTVLSPTTAARNFMSAMFFSLANGHFDLAQSRNSIASIKTYFKRTGDRANYLKKMRKLGVVYDTPYAGEMMDLLADSNLESAMTGGGKFKRIKDLLDFAQKFYSFGDDFWKIIGFENEKALLMKYKGMSESDAEIEAAERVRNTYPTYSLTGRFVNKLRRFPLAGTFVSFPAEVIRTSYHIARYAKKDWAESKAMGGRKIAGMALVGSFAYAIQEMSKALLGIDDDEEEAFRLMAPPWQKNSNIVFLGRDENGDLRYMDLSFADPYNYWKRPINALLRDQPVTDSIKSGAADMFTPFFGVDITAGTVKEAVFNEKGSGGRVFNPQAPIDDQAVDIANHLRKNLQPGIASNIERMYMAWNDHISNSGKRYTINDEALALVGFRVGTFSPSVSLYYGSYGFSDDKRDASSILSAVARSPNSVSEKEMIEALRDSLSAREKAYNKMLKLVSAARSSAMSDHDIRMTLKNSGIGRRDRDALLRGEVPKWQAPNAMMRNAVKKAEVLFDKEIIEMLKERKVSLNRLEGNTP